MKKILLLCFWVSFSYASDSLTIKKSIDKLIFFYNDDSKHFSNESEKEKHLNLLTRWSKKLTPSTNPSEHRLGLWAEGYLQYFNIQEIMQNPQTDINTSIEDLYLFSTKHHLKDLIPKVDLLRAIYYSKYKKDFKTAIRLANNSLQGAQKLSDSLTMALAYSEMGTNYNEIGMDDKAIEQFHKSIKLSNLPGRLYSDNVVIASIFEKRKNIKAVTYLNKAQKIALDNNFEDVFFLNIELQYVKIYLLNNKFSEAYKHIQKAEEIQNNLSHDMFLGRILYAKGEYYYSIAKYDKAIQYFKESLDFYKQQNFTNYYLKLNFALAKTYFKKDSIAQQLLPEQQTSFSLNRKYLNFSKQYITQCEELLPNIQSFKPKKDVYQLHKKIYLQENNYNKAFEYFQMEINMKDSMESSLNKTKFVEQELKYEYQQKKYIDSLQINSEKKIVNAQLAKQKSEKKLLYLGLLSITLLLVLGYSRYKYVQKKKQIEFNQQNLIIEKKQKEIIQTELELLKAQINPHFLFNVINTIYFKINRNNSDARDALMGFSEILRYQLYECNLDRVPIEKEIAYINQYITIQQMRQPDNTQCIITIMPTVTHFQIAPLLLMPLVENAFKYLRTDKTKQNTISIKADKTDNLFTFEIQNDYQISIKDTEDTSGGIGLSNIKRRLELLYPQQHELVITQDESKFTVHLELNI